jgi:hypothetical protein
VLLGVVVAFATVIGLILVRQRALSFEQASRLCQQQDPGDTPDGTAACVRSKQYPRTSPTSKVVVLVPLVLGGTAVVTVAIAGRRRPGGSSCPVCATELTPTDESCIRCGYPVRS